jgi:hypothetical protein
MKGFKYIFLPGLAVGLATVSATASNEAVIPVNGRGAIVAIHADGNAGIWLRARDGQWFYARTADACDALTSAVRIGFRTVSLGELDRYSSLMADGTACPLTSVVHAAEPKVGLGG